MPGTVLPVITAVFTHNTLIQYLALGTIFSVGAQIVFFFFPEIFSRFVTKFCDQTDPFLEISHNTLLVNSVSGFLMLTFATLVYLPLNSHHFSTNAT